LLIAILSRKPIAFDPSLAYVLSLFYLAIFGSIIAFGSFLSLIGKIGAGKAAYITMIIPVIALIISSLFEGYHWSTYSFAGVGLILAGNFVVILTKQHKLV
jgi:drug/metabolite transporter (DMT)-like permease